MNTFCAALWDREGGNNYVRHAQLAHCEKGRGNGVEQVLNDLRTVYGTALYDT